MYALDLILCRTLMCLFDKQSEESQKAGEIAIRRQPEHFFVNNRIGLEKDLPVLVS